MTQVIADHSIHCLDCGYNLTGLVQNRCPECSRRFDLQDSDTFAIDNPRGRPIQSGYAYLGASILGALIILQPFIGGRVGFRRWGLGAIFFGIVVEVFIASVGLGARSSGLARYGAPFYIAMCVALIAALMGIGFALLLIIVRYD